MPKMLRKAKFKCPTFEICYTSFLSYKQSVVQSSGSRQEIEIRNAKPRSLIRISAKKIYGSTQIRITWKTGAKILTLPTTSTRSPTLIDVMEADRETGNVRPFKNLKHEMKK